MNPTRTGIIDVLEKMGATFTVEPLTKEHQNQLQTLQLKHLH